MPKQPKILIAAGIYPPDPGGPALHAKAQFEGFPKLGAETGLVALAHFRKWPPALRHILYFETVLIKALGYDVVYAHDAVGSGIPAYLAAFALGKKFIVRIGGDLAWERKADAGATNLSLKEWYAKGEHQDERLFKLSRWLLRRADAVVVPSPLLKELYIEHYGVTPSRISVIANPVPEVPEAYESAEGNTIVYASRLVAYKNLSTVLKAVAEISRDYEDLKFVIMGDGPERKNLEKQARDLNIEKSVIFKGSVSQSEVLRATSMSRFAIAPALTEFNPNYILQSIAFGKPFLISRENGFAFDVPENLVFDPRDTLELESKMSRLLESDLYQEAKEEVSKIDFKQSWDNVLKANLEIVSSVLNGLK